MQQLHQKPITFVRQVLSLVTYPELENLVPKGTFPSDVLERAHKLVEANPGGSGAYSASKGIPVICQDVADFITRRDGYKCDASTVFLSNGASQSVQNALLFLAASSTDGFLTPIPQYPLYSATITLYNSKLVGYYLDENVKWGLNIEELERRVKEAKEQGIKLKGMVIINPGNPTGMVYTGVFNNPQCLNEKEMQECIRFCIKHRIVLMADEVYQENIYVKTAKFVSFRKVALDMGEEAASLQLISFHSISKGFFGECGRRGGYMQIMGFDKELYDQLFKLWSINLCSNVDGQVAVDVMVNPPKPGDPSYELYASERQAILDSLKKRAIQLSDALGSMPGISCHPVDGSLYIFFKVLLPEKAVEEAKKRGVEPDYLYCEELLNNTGIVTVPGSGFHQENGTYHVRTTFLPPEDQIESVIARMGAFQEYFMNKYK